MAADARITLSAVDQTKAAFESAKKNLTSLGDRAATLPGRFGTIGTAITAAFTAVTLKGAINTLDQLDDLSEKTGIAVESLSALRYAGEVVGTPLEAIATGVRKLSMNMAEAASGNKEAEATFRSMGISVKDGQGALKSQDALLLEMADKFAGYEDGAGKAALAQKVFGKSGSDMIPLLNQGSDGIRRLRGEAEGLGAVYGGQLAKDAAAFNDNLKKVELNAEAAKVSIVGSFLPALNNLIETFIRLKSAGLVWSAIEEGIKGVVGYIPVLGTLMRLLGGPTLTSDPGADINALMRERAEHTKTIAFAQKKGLPTEDLQKKLLKVDDQLEISRIRQSIAANKDVGDTSDAMSRRMFKPKTQAPTPRDKSGDQKASATYLAGLAKEYSNLAGTATKYDEVQEHLRINQDKFSASDRAKALAIAKQIDAFNTAKRAAESNAEALKARFEAMEQLDAAQADTSAALISETRALDEQRATLGMTSEELDRFNFQKRMQAELDKLQIALTEQLSNGQISGADAQRRMADATALANRATERFIELQRDVEARRRDPSQGVSDALKGYTDGLARQGDAAGEAVTRVVHTAEDVLTEFTTTGKLNAKGLIDTIISEFMRLQVIRPMMANLFGSGSAGESGLFKLFGGAGKGAGAGAAVGSSFGGGGLMDELLSIGVFHSGGMAGAARSYRTMPASILRSAPKYHGGGLAGDEVPAILQKGEGVFTAEQMRALGSGRSTAPVIIQNNNTFGDVASMTQVQAQLRASERRTLAAYRRQERYS